MKFATKNEDHGFFGTFKSNYETSEPATHRAFELARLAVLSFAADNSIAMTDDQARGWLDSRSGRHFADSLSFNKGGKSTQEDCKAALVQWRSMYVVDMRDVVKSFIASPW